IRSDPARWAWRSNVRAVIATSAPSAASRSAMAAPMPRLAPVTSARRPSKRRAIGWVPCSVNQPHASTGGSADVEIHLHRDDVLLVAVKGAFLLRVHADELAFLHL